MRPRRHKPRKRRVRRERTALERIAGSTFTGGVAALIAANYPEAALHLTALLPVLTGSLAHGRADARIKATLEDLQEQLNEERAALREMSDAQYRLVAGIVAVILETIDEEKLRFLKAAALNVAASDFHNTFEAQLFARILRDISAAEIRFLAELKGRSVAFGKSPGQEHLAFPDQVLFVDMGTTDGALAVGLLNMGLIVRAPVEGTFADRGLYDPSPVVEKLLQFLRG